MNSMLPMETSDHLLSPTGFTGAASEPDQASAGERRGAHRGDRFALVLGVICFLFLATLAFVDIMKALLVR